VSVVENPILLKGASMKRTVALIVVAAAAALVAAGCGSSSKSSSTTSKPSTQVSSTPGALSLGSTGLGKVLVGPNGRTLYLFEKDTGPKSTCTGSCAAEWPPFTTTGKPSAGSGVNAAMLSATKRPDGKRQVVYAGHPLYYYSADTKAGDTTGQGLDVFGAKWYVVSATGSKVVKTGGSASGGSAQGGYHY
jgi:predicted lipoprotein with Yx(FWY)xxD motif